MTLFGWDKKTSEFAIPNSTKKITSTFNTFNFLILKLSFKKNWKVQDSLDGTSKDITQKEAEVLIGKTASNPFSFVFNQSLIVVPLIIAVLGSGIIKAGPPKAPTVAAPMSVQNILKSKTWSVVEEKFVIENATDEESAKMEGKIKNAEKLKTYQISRDLAVKRKKASQASAPSSTPTTPVAPDLTPITPVNP